MSALFIRFVGDPPHLQHPTKPAQTVCGTPLLGLTVVSDLQALVFLGDQRCVTCDPSHKYHVLTRVAAA